MRQAERPGQDLFRAGEQPLGRAALKAAGAQVGGEDVREFDQEKALAAPVRVARLECLRVRRAVAFDQQVGEDVGINDDHDR